MKLSRILASALAIGAVAALGMSGAQAQSALSDILIVNGTSFVLNEGPGAIECGGLNANFACGPGFSIGDIVQLGGRAVALLEPVGAPVDPTQPCLQLLADGPVPPPQECISDVVGMFQDPTGLGLSVVLWSDPSLLLGAEAMLTFFGPNSVIYEDGTLQDITSLLGLPAPGSVLVQSDAGVVPVPAAVWLFGSAIGLMGVIRRKVSS